jgi:predicted TIM-barrel fold metal-dependent hydrolase
MGPSSDPVPADGLLEALEARGLVFELMAHPDQLADAAARLARFDELVVVVEHTGWPRSTSDEERTLWEAGMDALAALGDRVVCKLSGLAMPLGTMQADVLGPWLLRAIDAFGADRCMFASNFPVDAMHGTFDELYSTFTQAASGCSPDTIDKLFAANAERIYRI